MNNSSMGRHSRSCVWQDAITVASTPFIPWDDRADWTFVVTGATGLIGSSVVRALAAHNECFGSRYKIVLPVRDVSKASTVLDDVQGVEFIEWDAMSGKVIPLKQVDCIIHCSSPTASTFLSEHPVETIQTIVEGTKAMLSLAQKTGARLVYVSSMEVYGVGDENPLDESLTGSMDTQNPRNSYPVAKMLAEQLCTSFCAEQYVHACVARLAQSFGPGVDLQDKRIFAHIARACRQGIDIHLATSGTKRNMYVYTADAVSALLLLALKGENGAVYNVANEDTYISIREMAEEALARFGSPNTHVIVDDDPQGKKRYPSPGSLRLDTSKLRALGWSATRDLMDMYDNLICSWSESDA